MSENPLVRLGECGQSVWIDFLRRHLVASGELQRLISVDGIRGVSSNPNIFAKAVAGSSDYDDSLARLVDEGRGVREILEDLAIQDVSLAAGCFASTYDESGGAEGFACMAVSPHLAADTEALIEGVRRLAGSIDAPNVMFQIPGTPLGVAAVDALVAEGHSINVTLLYSTGGYRKAAEAYVAGLEKLAGTSTDLRVVSSVASFSLSDLDVLVDDLLGEHIRASAADTSRAESLLGNIATASAKLAYQAHREIFSSDRWLALAERGARVQRLMWAGTGSRNPLFRDVRYVEELVGPDTINGMSLSTMTAFRDHGEVSLTLDENLDVAGELLDELSEAGIDLVRVAGRLQEEGMAKARTVHDQLVATITRQRERVLAGEVRPQVFALGEGSEAQIATVADELDKGQFVQRLWAKDAGLWTDDEEVQRSVRNRLGWLDIVEGMLGECAPVARFGASVQKSDIEHVVLLGMGGSSLCPEVCAKVFGVQNFLVLDSTVPAAVRAIEEQIDPARTMFVVSSKSGTTTETRAFADYFYSLVAPVLANPGDRFVAVTDPGTPLAQLAHERRFRRLWLNPPDIGGRYSALSYFGLVPMALMGIDIHAVVDTAYRMVQSCAPGVPVADNAGVSLGVALFEAFRTGRDKITFAMSPRLAAFGDWVEQLIAESTGKEGVGLVPVHGEPLGQVEDYGDDRFFVSMRFENEEDATAKTLLEDLSSAGHPLVRLVLQDPSDLGEEFFRWEVAVAVAGSLMGINPFDEPNVKEAKDRTGELLSAYESAGALPEPAPVYTEDGLSVFADLDADTELAKGAGGNVDLVGWLRAHLGRAKAPDYVGIQAFVGPDEGIKDDLARMRCFLRDRLGVATTFGWGPRFLHSTGQLHKGGPDRGVFLQITADDAHDIDCLGRSYTFGVLARAQALGDLQALQDRGQRVLRIHASGEPRAAIKKLVIAVDEALL